MAPATTVGKYVRPGRGEGLSKVGKVKEAFAAQTVVDIADALASQAVASVELGLAHPEDDGQSSGEEVEVQMLHSIAKLKKTLGMEPVMKIES